jgi:hypothetical protein
MLLEAYLRQERDLQYFVAPTHAWNGRIFILILLLLPIQVSISKVAPLDYVSEGRVLMGYIQQLEAGQPIMGPLPAAAAGGQRRPVGPTQGPAGGAGPSTMVSPGGYGGPGGMYGGRGGGGYQQGQTQASMGGAGGGGWNQGGGEYVSVARLPSGIA